MHALLKVPISGLAIASLAFVGAPVRACLPQDPRQILDAIDARQGFDAIAETSGAYSRSVKAVRFRYWRGSCMLYWLGTGREAGIIHWQTYDTATLDQGRLLLASADQIETVTMAFADAMTKDDRGEAVAAAHSIIQYCRRLKR